MKQYTIAEILHIAADKHLAANRYEEGYHRGDKEKFSCCAVSEAIWYLWDEAKIISPIERDKLIERCSEGLEAMGCPTNSMYAFSANGEFNEEDQQARYAWLKFAAIIAEEQGV